MRSIHSIVGLSLIRGETREYCRSPGEAFIRHSSVTGTSHGTEPDDPRVGHRRLVLRARVTRGAGSLARPPRRLPHVDHRDLPRPARVRPIPRAELLADPLADRHVAQRRGLRRDRALESSGRRVSSALVPHQRSRPRRYADPRAPSTRPRSLPIPHVVGGDRTVVVAARAPHRTRHQRCSTVGQTRTDLVPAGRDRQDPLGLLLRVVLRGQPRAALDADATHRPTPNRPPEGAVADSLRVGILDGHPRRRERHRVRASALRAVHLDVVGDHRLQDLRRPRHGPLRGRNVLRRALLRSGAPANH
jgi:hypothetical protein